MQSSHFIVSGFPISEGVAEYHLEQKHLAINLAQIRPQSETKAPAFNCKQTSLGRPPIYSCVRRRPLAFAAVLIGGALC